MTTVPKRFDLPRWIESLASVEAEVRSMTDGLTESQFHAPPRTGGWSVGYCLEHLILAGEAFLAIWDLALEEGRAHLGDSCCSHFPYQWWERAILRQIEPPYRMKVKASQGLLPRSRRSVEETVQRFGYMHREIKKRVEDSRSLLVKDVRVRSPLASWISYPLDFSFDLVLAHERRHLWQAKEVKRLIAHQ